jgi:hypothetical protein
MIKDAVKELIPFIPQNLRLDIFASLWEEYRDKEKLAEELGCKPALIDRWLKQGKPPNDKYIPQILFLALQCSGRAREILQVEVVEQMENIFAVLGISQENVRGDFGKLLEVLDEKSRQILWYLWWNRHAEIGKLVEITMAESDMEVLSRLKNVINPAALKVMGKEIVKFESFRIDPLSGEKILFSWWLEEDMLLKKKRESLMDIFDEGDHVALIVQLSTPVQLSTEAQVDYRNGILRVKVEKIKKSELRIKDLK